MSGRKRLDLTDDRYGRLTVLKESVSIGYNRRWLCMCDCGNSLIVHQKNLRNGNTKSCGCLRLSRLKKAKTKDLTGKNYSHLIVIKRLTGKDKFTKYLCKCECGKELYVYGTNLTQGHTKSCGCRPYELTQKAWNKKSEDELMEMVKDGSSYSEISKKTNRTVAALKKKVSQINVSKKYRNCVALDCKIKFEPKSHQQKYCSDQCRWRTYRKSKKKERIKKNLCPQCGGNMDDSKISYCKKCREYFNSRYKKPPTGKC